MTLLVDPQDLQRRLRDLAPIPQVVHVVLELMRSDEVGVDEVADRLACDPALAARALRVANSPFYGVAGRIGSVRDALRVLGFRRLGTALTAAAISGHFKPPACAGFALKPFWSHSFATAICAQRLAAACCLDDGVAFIAGLLHDIGRLVLATYYPEELAAAIRNALARDVALIDGERATLELDHCAVGAWVAEHWHFAAPITRAIRGHHEPPAVAAGSPASLADIVHVADGVAHALDLSHEVGEIVPPMALEPWTRLGLSSEVFLDIFAQVEAAHAAMCEALSI